MLSKIFSTRLTPSSEAGRGTVDMPLLISETHQFRPTELTTLMSCSQTTSWQKRFARREK